METSKDKISETLLDVELSNFMSDLKNKISQEILDGYSLNEIANNNSLSINTIKNAERMFDTVEDDLARNEIVAKAFSSNKDFVSDIEDINSSQSIIINVDNIMFEKPYELNEIFEKVSNDWIKSLKIEEIENYIEESIASSRSFKDVSIHFKAEISSIDLQQNNNDYPSMFKNKVFDNNLNQIYFSTSDNDVFIAKTNNVTFPEDSKNNQGINLSTELRGSFGAEIVKSKNISTNDNLIQALISQY